MLIPMLYVAALIIMIAIQEGAELEHPVMMSTGTCPIFFTSPVALADIEHVLRK